MKTVLLQTDIRWADEMANIREAERLIGDSAGADLYVLPEMWSTGFITNPQEGAVDEKASRALQWMRDAARKNKCAICGSLAVQTADGHYRNRLYFVNGRTDELAYYDKRHLFTYGNEHTHYEAGQTHTIVSYDGMRLLLEVCYDLRFPCWSRYATERQYDAIIFVANWPASRQSAWQILTRARAIENQCYVIAVNRVGDDKNAHYIGGSSIIDPIGRTVVQASFGHSQAVEGDLSLASLQQKRSRFRVLDDRDELRQSD
ncbi:MAG: nitrilase family protein [Prevotella sp.]|nr:nitrilase family protein [Prevotella sp.]